MIIAKDLLVIGDYLRLPTSKPSSPSRVQAKKNATETQIQCDLPDLQYDLTFNNIRTTPIPVNGFALHDISGQVKAGEMLAVMGPTGCGKTSLLNALSGRLRLQSGSIHLNDERLSKRIRRTRIGYVLQQDVFFSDLTLKQTLIYTALLRLPDSKYTRAEKLDKVEEIIDALDLRRAQHTIVGDAAKRGLSGGEKKRLSIACELITNPSVLLIDEPTSGLDSCTATTLMQMLKEYATKQQKCVILAVHQPSSKIFHLFDQLLLLSDGKTAYFGHASSVVPHFASVGLQIAPHYNPADFILEQLKSSTSLLLQSWTNTAALLQISLAATATKLDIDFNSSSSTTSDNNDSDIYTAPADSAWPTSFWTQVRILAERNFHEARPRILSTMNWVQAVVLAIMAGLVWFKTERKEETLPDLEGWMFFSSTFWMLFSLFGALASFPGERPIIEKERLSGFYRLSSYYFAKMLGEAPLIIVLPAVYLIISYPLLGGNVASFFGVLCSQMLSALAAQSAGFFFGAALELSAAITAAAIFTLAAQLLGGFLARNIPPTLKAFSLVYHALRNMQLLEYNYGLPIECASVNGTLTTTAYPLSCSNATLRATATSTTSPHVISPRELLAADELQLPWWSHTLFLFGFLILFRVLGYIVMRRSLAA